MNWSYIAGLFDGEGSVFIGTDRCHPQSNYTRTRVRVKITNTHKGLLERVRGFLGYGCISSSRRTRPGCAECYMLWVQNQEAARGFLEHIRDELIVKREECDKALKWLTEKGVL